MGGARAACGPVTGAYRGGAGGSQRRANVTAERTVPDRTVPIALRAGNFRSIAAADGTTDHLDGSPLHQPVHSTPHLLRSRRATPPALAEWYSGGIRCSHPAAGAFRACSSPSRSRFWSRPSWDRAPHSEWIPPRIPAARRLRLPSRVRPRPRTRRPRRRRTRSRVRFRRRTRPLSRPPRRPRTRPLSRPPRRPRTRPPSRPRRARASRPTSSTTGRAPPSSSSAGAGPPAPRLTWPSTATTPATASTASRPTPRASGPSRSRTPAPSKTRRS